ncbi:MAG: metal-dependent transcriptional regulator [Bacteroidetes bacterium]|nr:metal-dependent transcriptional regulator [Bacteroidota bacterium]
MTSFVKENYLKALFYLSKTTGEVNINDLSKQLDIKMPTVTSMMKKLAALNLVHYESYKPVRLTEKGELEAALIIRKHRLTEMYLVEKMGFGWEDVHQIAEQMEHIHSPALFERMDKLLGFPKFDPHGSPIPDKTGKVTRRTYTKLSDCKKGESVMVSAVYNATDEFLKFLNAKEIQLGVKMNILFVEPFDKTMVISYKNRLSETLSHTVSERLLVELVK